MQAGTVKKQKWLHFDLFCRFNWETFTHSSQQNSLQAGPCAYILQKPPVVEIIEKLLSNQLHDRFRSIKHNINGDTPTPENSIWFEHRSFWLNVLRQTALCILVVSFTRNTRVPDRVYSSGLTSLRLSRKVHVAVMWLLVPFTCTVPFPSTHFLDFRLFRILDNQTY
jgi:hypothetical protein